MEKIPDEFERSLHKKCLQSMNPAMDSESDFYYDLFFTAALKFLDERQHDNTPHTYGDFVKDLTSGEDGGRYKIYDEYKDKRIIKEKTITVILTTIHKVKGLEFDIVIVAPSFSSLPLGEKLHKSGENCKRVNLEEEKRLTFVAYTRAKKRLNIYTYKREECLKKMECYKGTSTYNSCIFGDEPKLKNYVLSSNARKEFINHSIIQDQVKKHDPVTVKIEREVEIHDPVTVKKENKGSHATIYWENNNRKYEIGRLSFSSSIPKQLKKKKYRRS